MPDVPLEVVADILLWLPVEPLLRFRCVSKPWCALIDDHDFIKSHLKRSIETKNHLSLMLRDCGLYYVGFDSLDNAVELNHPLKCDQFGTEILGSCDGLVCLYNGEEDIAIWNPSTRRHQKLPITEIDFPDYFTACQYIIYGFGYDPIGDDYKIVRLIQFYGDDVWDSFDSEVKVYSMKSNSWRKIKDFPYYLRYKRGYGVLVGSALHWVVSRKPESDAANLIAAFDLGTEEYRLVPQPNFPNKDFHMNVGELDGCLCIMCNLFQVQVDLWVMEYGLKESWRKLFSVAQQEVIRSFDFVTPLAYSKSRHEILLVQDNTKLIWYDLERKKVKNINVRGIPDYFETAICVESLVRLTGGGKTYGKNQDGKGKKKKKKRPKKNGKKRDDFLSEGFKLVL